MDNQQACHELKDLVKKLSPLSNLDVETITKLAENIEKLANLSIAQESVANYSAKKLVTDKTLGNDLSSWFFSCHSISASSCTWHTCSKVTQWQGFD